MFTEDEIRDMFELVHCRLYQCNLKLLELNDDEELYKYIKNKIKSYESIINKLRYDK